MEQLANLVRPRVRDALSGALALAGVDYMRLLYAFSYVFLFIYKCYSFDAYVLLTLRISMS